jgi:hypothetical protein
MNAGCISSYLSEKTVHRMLVVVLPVNRKKAAEMHPDH